MKQWYLRTVRLCLDYRKTTLAVATVFFVLSLSARALHVDGARAARQLRLHRRAARARRPAPRSPKRAEWLKTVRKRLSEISGRHARLHDHRCASVSNGFRSERGRHGAQGDAHHSIAAARQAEAHAGRVRARSFAGACRICRACAVAFGFGGFGEKLQISLAGDDPNLLANGCAGSRAGRARCRPRERHLLREPRAAGDSHQAAAGAHGGARRARPKH